MSRPIHAVIVCLAALALTGCTANPRFNRVADALNPWPAFGSSRRLVNATSPLAPRSGLTMRRVADGEEEVQTVPLGPEPGDVWPTPAMRRNTLADFERSLHDGTPPPISPSRNATP